MAISPNVDFVAGNILTAAQQNQFPRGIVAYTQSTSSSASIGTTETVTLTSTSFTAVANRYYKVTYFEPILQPGSPNPIYMQARIRLTNISGAIQQFADIEPVISTGGDGQMMTMNAVITLTAGATTICGTLQCATNTVVAVGTANARRFILVEDLGPA